MDSYAKDLHLQDKDYDSDIRNNDLSSLEGDQRDARPRFSVEEPLEVQLRFDLGSLVDAQVLLDTRGPRESHWDFVRQEQGRFQTSSEDSTALLAHVKQDDLKSFDNCAGWPRSTSQVDPQLFMDTHDDVSMITEAFGGKDRSGANLVEDDGSLMPPSYGHREQSTGWAGEEKEAREGDIPCRESIDNEAVEATQISMERPGTPSACCNSTTEFSTSPFENTDIQTVGNNETPKAEQSVIEPVMNSEHRIADNVASVTVTDPPCNVSSEVNVHKGLPLDRIKKNQADSAQPEASSTHDVQVSVQMAVIVPAEEGNVQIGTSINAGDSCVLVEESDMTAVKTKADAEPHTQMLESMGKNLEAGHLMSSRAEETQETGTAYVFDPGHIISHSGPTGDMVSHTSQNIENETAEVISNTLDKQVSLGRSCFESENTLQSSEVIAEPDSDEKQRVSELPCPEVQCLPEATEAMTPSSNSMVRFEDRSLSNSMHIGNDESVNGLDVALTLGSCKKLEKIGEVKGKAGEASYGQEHQTHVAAVELAGTNSAGDKVVESVKLLTAEQQVMCLEPAASAPQQDAADISTCVKTHEKTSFCNKEKPTVEISCKDNADISTRAEDVGTGANLSNSTPMNTLKEIDLSAQEVRDCSATQVSADIGTEADLSKLTPENAPKESDVCAQEERDCSGPPQISAVHCDDDASKPADYDARPKDHAFIKNVDLDQHGGLKSKTLTVLTVEDSSLRDEIEAQSTDESTGQQEKLPTDGSEALTQEPSTKLRDTDQSALDYSISSAKPIVLNEDKGITESTHPGGVLHVMLDVHREGATGNSVPKEGSFPDHMKLAESKESVNASNLNPGEAMRKGSPVPEGAAAGVPGTPVSGLTGVSTMAGFREDEQPVLIHSSPQQENTSKKKADSSNRNNRLKDSARASPLQGRSDGEQKDAGKEGLGKRKSTPKNTAPKKGTEPGEGFPSPLKSVTKSSLGRKKEVSSPIVQEVIASPAAKDGFQTPASRNKNVFAVNTRQQALPDVNGSEVSVPMVLPTQPFTEPQQVQLRAQILVYGSLIQGAAPEEALMVAAFSNVIGAAVREAGRDLDASGRVMWEKQWQGAVDRIQAKSSRDTLRDSSRGSGALVSNVSVSSAKASEAGLKSNSSSGATSSMVDVRNVAGLHSKVSDVPAAKSHPSLPRQASDLGPITSVTRSNQSIAVVVPPGPSTSVPFRSVPASLSENVNQFSKARVDQHQATASACYPTPPPSENLSQSSKVRVDVHQATPPAYYPTPPLGSFLAGAPPWLSTAAFPGSWISQTQGNVYNTPSSLFSHPQAIVTSDQAPDMAMARRNTAPSAGSAAHVNPIIPAALYTPVVGTMSVTPTPAADLGQKRQSTSDARPRKRKKTQSEIYVSLTDGVPNASFVVGTSNQITSVSDFPAGQAGLLMSSPLYPPSLPASESLAMVVAKTQTPKPVQETSIVAVNANKSLGPDSSNVRNANISSTRVVEQQLGKFMGLPNSASELAQAEASAEEAASLAASAVRESESFWSQLKAQGSAGLALDIESQLASSAVAMATAASVAKAAAAAAKAAYEAALQAKTISEDILGSSKQGNELESSRLLPDKAERASQVWGMPGSCNSIMEAAKVASKKRLEAASVAMARAHNLESILRAAELATNAVSQVGSVISMGESLPFTLEMLMEAGPEGLQRFVLGSLEDKENTLESAGKKGTPPKHKDLIENEKKSSKKSIGTAKEVSMQREAQVDSWTTESVIPARSDFDARINADLGAGLMTEFITHNNDDHLALSMPASRQASSPARLESGLTMQQEVSLMDNQIMKGSLVEVMSNEKGLRGVWFSARVQNIDGGKVFVLYDDLLSDDGFSPLEEWIQLKGSPSKAPRVRLAHPNTNISFEGTRKRRREALGNHKWSVGDRVDAWMRDGWWEGEIKEIIEDGESKAKVFFPCDGDTSLMKTSKLRPSLVWSNEQWVLWTDAKQGKGEGSKGRGILHEGETPVAKRQRTEKGLLLNASCQKLFGISMAGAQKEGSLFDSAPMKIPTDLKGFPTDGTDKSKQQGSKVMFGVPRPTKKRKLMEVSKHYNPGRGVRSTNTLDPNITNSKHEEVRTAVVGITPGSTEGSRLDSLKAKKKVLPSQKMSISETANPKGNVNRSKKERPFADSKPLARKNVLAREELPAALKRSDGKVVSKRKPPLEMTRSESEEQADGFPIIDISSQKVASPSSTATLEASDCFPVLPEESGKDPSHTAQRSGKPSEKQTSYSGKDSGKDSANTTQARESKQTTVKEKLPSQQTKDKNKQTLNPAIANKHPSRKKEVQLSDSAKDNKEPPHSLKESQKQSLVLAKETESQPAHEGEKHHTSPVSSREKRPTSPTTDSEKQPKETEKGKDAGKATSETWEPRRTSRKIQPTSKLLEGLQTAPKLGKNSSLHDKGSRAASKAAHQQ